MVIWDNNEELDEILRQDFTTVFRPGYINVNGVTMPERYAEMKQDIFNLEVSENDVWVCSFPKTGKRRKFRSFFIALQINEPFRSNAVTKINTLFIKHFFKSCFASMVSHFHIILPLLKPTLFDEFKIHRFRIVSKPFEKKTKLVVYI